MRGTAATVCVEPSPEKFIDSMLHYKVEHHLVLAYGDWREDLTQFAQFAGIEILTAEDYQFAQFAGIERLRPTDYRKKKRHRFPSVTAVAMSSFAGSAGVSPALSYYRVFSKASG